MKFVHGENCCVAYEAHLHSKNWGYGQRFYKLIETRKIMSQSFCRKSKDPSSIMNKVGNFPYSISLVLKNVFMIFINSEP